MKNMLETNSPISSKEIKLNPGQSEIATKELQEIPIFSSDHFMIQKYQNFPAIFHHSSQLELDVQPGLELPTGGFRVDKIPAGGWRGGEEIPAGGWRGGEEMPTGGWHSPTLERDTTILWDTYRTKDGKYYFEFAFYPIGSDPPDYYEIDIIKMPSYRGRDTSLHTTHRLNSDRGGQRICFGNNYVVNSLEAAKHWASVWSECTMNYIIYGNNIPNN